jgi:hypothetical protein
MIKSRDYSHITSEEGEGTEEISPVIDPNIFLDDDDIDDDPLLIDDEEEDENLNDEEEDEY